AYEFWYYLFFPLLWQACFGSGRIWLRVLLIGSAGMMLIFVGKSIAMHFPIWLMGVAAYLARNSITKLPQFVRWSVAGGAGIATIVCMAASRAGWLADRLPAVAVSSILGLCFAVVVCFVITLP